MTAPVKFQPSGDAEALADMQSGIKIFRLSVALIEESSAKLFRTVRSDVDTFIFSLLFYIQAACDIFCSQKYQQLCMKTASHV